MDHAEIFLSKGKNQEKSLSTPESIRPRRSSRCMLWSFPAPRERLQWPGPGKRPSKSRSPCKGRDRSGVGHPPER